MCGTMEYPVAIANREIFEAIRLYEVDRYASTYTARLSATIARYLRSDRKVIYQLVRRFR